LNEVKLTMKHYLITKTFDIHLNHHVFISLLYTLNVLGNVKAKVFFE
jgi:hypothetical protein